MASSLPTSVAPSASQHRATRSPSVTSTESKVPANASPRRFLSELEGQSPFAFIGPNWFASIMGTGIIANAAVSLPWQPPGLLPLARGVWVLDLLLLIVVVTATTVHWLRFPETAKGHLNNPVMSHFYGAPAMALMTVGAGALLLGDQVLGEGLALTLAATLWSAGTIFGLWTAVAVPLKAITTHRVGSSDAFGGWLMPVVPPMVTAATGPLFLPHLPAGQARLTMLTFCLMMFGLTLVASVLVISMIWGRLIRHGVGEAAGVPTLWIVLGPLGQSITASHTMGVSAPDVLPAPYANAVESMGIVYGLPMWGFAMLWVALAAAITIQTARSGLPFSLTWWSFTFPVGTVVTGTSGLAVATGADLFSVAAVVFYVGLVVAWLVVATRTIHGVYVGRLLRAPV